MKILCPNCDSENDTASAVAGVIQCGCGEWFAESPSPERARQLRAASASRQSAIPASSADDGKVFANHIRKNAAAKIRAQAASFETMSFICVAVAVIAMLAGLVAAVGVEGHTSWTCWVLFGGFLGLALWFYLIAQIIHIRANTEK